MWSKNFTERIIYIQCNSNFISFKVDEFSLGETMYGNHIFDENETDGRMEVCLDGGYGTIRDNLWNQEDASVARRQLGLSPYGKSSDFVQQLDIIFAVLSYFLCMAIYKIISVYFQNIFITIYL